MRLCVVSQPERFQTGKSLFTVNGLPWVLGSKKWLCSCVELMWKDSPPKRQTSEGNDLPTQIDHNIPRFDRFRLNESPYSVTESCETTEPCKKNKLLILDVKKQT